MVPCIHPCEYILLLGCMSADLCVISLSKYHAKMGIHAFGNVSKQFEW